MSYKTDTELKTQVDAVIVVNGNREITPPLDNSIRTNFIDSKLNLAGGNVLLALTGYATLLTPTDNKHLTPKKYVDDLVSASVSDVAYSALWNGITTISPSKNAVYDKIELIDAAKLNLSGGTMAGSLLLPYGSAANGFKSLAIGGPGTGLYRDGSLDGLKLLINNVDALWIDAGTVAAKGNFTVAGASTTTGITYANGGIDITSTGGGSDTLNVGATNANIVNISATKTINIETAGVDATTILIDSHVGNLNLKSSEGGNVSIDAIGGGSTSLSGTGIELLIDAGYTKGWIELEQTYAVLGFSNNTTVSSVQVDATGVSLTSNGVGKTISLVNNNTGDITISTSGGNISLSTGAGDFSLNAVVLAAGNSGTIAVTSDIQSYTQLYNGVQLSIVSSMKILSGN